MGELTAMGSRTEVDGVGVESRDLRRDGKDRRESVEGRGENPWKMGQPRV